MLNLDFQQRVVINTSEQDWIDSPSAGVKRKLLEREEAERGRATSIVEYKPGALVKWPHSERFKPHRHLGAFTTRSWMKKPLSGSKQDI